MAPASDNFFEQPTSSERPPPGDVRGLLTWLWQGHRKMVFLYAYALVRNHDEAEEITSATFERAASWLLRHPAAERGEMNYRSWLIVIVKNLVRDARRKKRARPWSEVDAGDEDESTWDAPDPAACSPADAAVRDEEVAALTNCVQGLADDSRRIVELRYVQRLKTREIADQLGIQTAAAAQRLHRLTKQLRECVEAALAC